MPRTIFDSTSGSIVDARAVSGSGNAIAGDDQQVETRPRGYALFLPADISAPVSVQYVRTKMYGIRTGLGFRRGDSMPRAGSVFTFAAFAPAQPVESIADRAERVRLPIPAED